MTVTTIPTGATEPIQMLAIDGDSAPLAGLTDLYIRILRFSDGQFLDWADNTFKAAGHTTLDQVLTEVDATNATGLYELTGGWDTSLITNKAADDTYTVVVIQTPGTNARLPAPIQIKEGQTADAIGKIDSVATIVPASAATGSLLDRLANKDGTKSYNQATDSLQAIRDRSG